MPRPTDKDARLFYRVARQRFEEARELLQLGYTTVAIYLGGYVVETVLKALIIENSPRARRATFALDFRGGKGHDLDLRRAYYNTGGAMMAASSVRSFVRVNAWSTSLRYHPGSVPAKTAAEFLRAVQDVFQWADGRL